MTKQQIDYADALANLVRRGFDLSAVDEDDRHLRVRCSQCESLVINGIACHEEGCPNQRKAKDDEDYCDEEFADG